MGLFNGRKKVHIGYLGNFSRGITHSELDYLKASLCSHLRDAEVNTLSEEWTGRGEQKTLVIHLEEGGSIRFECGFGTPATIVIDSKLNRKQIGAVLEKVETDLLEKGFQPFAGSDHCFFTR